MSCHGEIQPQSRITDDPRPRKKPPPPPPKPRKFVLSPPVSPTPRPAVRSRYFINNIPLGTKGVKLFNMLVAPPHWSGGDDSSPKQVQPQVQFFCNPTASRLDDELSVAVIEFTDTPHWLQQANLDPYGFPKKTALGTLWRGVDTAARDSEGQTEFMRAAIDNNVLYAEMLAEFSDTDTNIQDNSGRTALHWACVKNLTTIVMLCLSVPECDVGLRDQDDLTAFDIARNNDNEGIQALFYTSMIDLEETDPQGALLRVLTVTSEPVVDKPDFPGAAIFQPILEQNKALVTALVARGVDLSATNSDGDTPLHVAAAQLDNVDIARKLLEAGSDIAATGAGGATPLHRASSTADKNMVQVLLEWKADVAAKDSDDKTALHVAAKNGRYDAVQLLVDHGADMTAKDDAGLTPLQLAENSHQLGMVVLLKEIHQVEVQKMVEVALPLPEEIKETNHTKPKTLTEVVFDKNLDEALNQLQYEGGELPGMDDLQDPLHSAATSGDTDIVIRLLVNGANPEATDQYGRAAMHLAAINGHAEIVTALLANGANRDAANRGGLIALHLAAAYGHTDVIIALLAEGANPEVADPQGRTALHLAAEYGNADVILITALLAKGANSEAADPHGRTALHLAARYGHAEIVKALLANGANPQAVGSDGHTALLHAAKIGHTEIVTALLAKGANPEAADPYGRTALRYAINNGHTETVTALLATGAIMPITDRLRYSWKRTRDRFD